MNKVNVCSSQALTYRVCGQTFSFKNNHNSGHITLTYCSFCPCNSSFFDFQQRKDESAPIFVKLLYIKSHFIIFHAYMYMYRVFCHTFFISIDKWFLACLRGPQGRLVPPTGSPSVNKVFLLTQPILSKCK